MGLPARAADRASPFPRFHASNPSLPSGRGCTMTGIKAGGLQTWFNDFLNRWKPVRRDYGIHAESGCRRKPGGERRAQRIKQFGICSRCGDRAVASGNSVRQVEARKENLCYYCFTGAAAPTGDPSGTKLRNRIGAHGLCSGCGLRAVSNGGSPISIQAADEGLCIICCRMMNERDREGDRHA